MWSRTAPMTASLLAFTMSNAVAQQDSLSSPSYDRVSIAAGVAGSQRRDLVVSPATFAGAGFSSTGTYEHGGRLATITASATWDAQHFRAQGGAIATSEHVMQGGGRLGVLRRVAGDGEWRVSAGAALGLSVIGTDHQYSDPSGSRASFFAAFGTLGPAANLERRLGGGSARVD